MKPLATVTFLLLSALAAICHADTTVKVSVGQSIQKAIDSLPSDGSSAIIEVETGAYNENITIVRPNISFHASGSGPVVLQQSVENYAVVYIDYDSSDISFYDFQIINTIGEAAGNQNAFRSYSDRIALYNCKLVGYGDTAWFSAGSVYVYNSWIEGTNNGVGSVSAPGTLESDTKGGFIFMNANFTPVISSIYDKRQENAHSYSKPLSEENFENTVILSRPWHNNPRNIILKSTISSHIQPADYDAWNYSDDNLKTKVYYAEYSNTGSRADTSQRVSWSKTLTDEEAAPYLSPSKFFENLGLGTSWIDSKYLS